MGCIAEVVKQRTYNSDSWTRCHENPFGNQTQRKKDIWQGDERKVERSKAKNEEIRRRWVETWTVFFGNNKILI